MIDLKLDGGKFSDTEADVIAVSEKGRALLGQVFSCAGVAPISIRMPKSKAIDFARFAEQKGLVTA